MPPVQIEQDDKMLYCTSLLIYSISDISVIYIYSLDLTLGYIIVKDHQLQRIRSGSDDAPNKCKTCLCAVNTVHSLGDLPLMRTFG